MSVPSVSAIMPTYNRADVVARTLAHLAAQTHPHDRLEVIVVDNSTDDTPARVLEAARAAERDGGPSVRLVRMEERLPAVKRNAGLRAADGDLVLWMNDDLWLEPGAVAAHVAAHHRLGPDVAVLGHCRQSPEMERTPFIEAFEPFAYHLLDHDDLQARLPYSFFWSMNLSMPRRTMLERNLVFHEDWRHIGHEDVELGWRWTQAGLALHHEPAARGDHFHPHTVASAAAVQHAIGRGLRDLEGLVADPHLLERYGLRHRSNRPKAYARHLLRDALFNGRTVPSLQRRLDAATEPSALHRWLYWKVLLAATTAGYRAEVPRRPVPVPTHAPAAHPPSTHQSRSPDADRP